MNIYDISRKTGYSIATVSRVINGKDNVSEKAKKAILDVVEKEKYVPNAYAIGLGKGSVQTVGLLCSDVNDLYHAGAVSFLQRELRQRNYECLLSCTGHFFQNKQHAVRLMISKQVDAIVLIGSHFLQGDCSYLLEAAQKIPIVLINGKIDGKNIYCIRIDDYSVVKQVTLGLVQRGRKRLLYLYDKKTPSALSKRQGFWDVVKKSNGHGYEILVSSNDIQSTEKEVHLLLNHTPINAVVASEDEMAIGALKAVIAQGKSVPKEVEIIGYNNSQFTACCRPELTSIDSRRDDLCMQAVEILFRLFDNESVPQDILLPAYLASRETTLA